mmetsp:Transcript_24880/g.35101  ORF Transcript_24880/g.35101 Transcript_24880/m.35101 type:complete len:137 (+) Transcript_24880:41-451(+)
MQIEDPFLSQSPTQGAVQGAADVALEMSVNAQSNTEELVQQPDEQQGQVKKGTIAKVIGGLCALLLTIIGFILMVVFGSICVSGDDAYCGAGGYGGGVAMLLIGIAPFATLITVMIYNACSFAHGGDENNWPLAQF